MMKITDPPLGRLSKRLADADRIEFDPFDNGSWVSDFMSFNPPNDLLCGVSAPNMTAADLGLEGPIWPVVKAMGE